MRRLKGEVLAAKRNVLSTCLSVCLFVLSNETRAGSAYWLHAPLMSQMFTPSSKVEIYARGGGLLSCAHTRTIFFLSISSTLLEILASLPK